MDSVRGPAGTLTAGVDGCAVSLACYVPDVDAHYERALAAGIAIRHDTLRGSGVRVAVGLDAGPITWAYLGSHEGGRVHRVVLGEPIMRAERLSRLAKDNEVLMTDTFRSAVEDTFEVTVVGQAQMPGETNTVQVVTVASAGGESMMDSQPDVSASEELGSSDTLFNADPIITGPINSEQ